MGKKRIITTGGSSSEAAKSAGTVSVAKKSVKKQVLKGTVYISSSYNNTIVSVADSNGNVFAYSSAGMMGFKGARKSTPYAAQVTLKNAIDKAKPYSLESVEIFVSGVGQGRESAVRALQGTGLTVANIKDITPIPHNGTRPKKPRRV